MSAVLASPANWNQIFESDRAWNRYPPEELVRFCAGRKPGAVIDFGCGPASGASWFLAREGWQYVGCDTSHNAIKRSEKRFDEEKLKGSWVESLALLPSDHFDLFVDIASLQHIPAPNFYVAEAYRILKPGGELFSIHAADDCSRRPYKEFGMTRFANRRQMADLFYRQFMPASVEQTTRTIDQLDKAVVDWIWVCKKPNLQGIT